MPVLEPKDGWSSLGSRSFSPRELLSAGELEAEWIFVEAMRRRLLFTEACILARNLESRSAVGAAYLRWLLCGRIVTQ